MSFERFKARLRTLRARLMIWDAAAVFLTAVAVLIGVREGVRFALLHEIDEVLLEDIDEINLLLKEPRVDGEVALFADLDRKARGHTHHVWFVMLLDGNGKPAWSSERSPQDPVTMQGILRVPRDTPVTRHGFRVIFTTLSNPIEGRHGILVGSSLQIATQDLVRIDQLVIVIGLVALILAPLGGFLLANRAIRPIAEQTRTAARLRPTQLDERLPTRNSGDELDRLAITFNALLDRTAEYLRQKHDFLANAAHELRTPLAAIRSSVEVALNSDRSAEEYRELLGDVIEETESLELLVRQLLLLAEVDADRLKIHAESLRLEEVIQAACDMFQATAESLGIRLDVQLSRDVLVEGNRQHLRQVINNLIDNAIKYTTAKRSDSVRQDKTVEPPLADTIHITLRPDLATQEAILIVEDHGIGIAAEHLPHVFERFYRADQSRARVSKVTGTGLGLSICHAIISAHRGQIAATSELGRGSLFRITLPLLMAPLAE